MFVHPDDIVSLGFKDGDVVDLVAHWDDDDVERVAERFRIVAYDTPRGIGGGLLPRDQSRWCRWTRPRTAATRRRSKSVIIRLVPEGTGRESGAAEGASQDAVGSDESHKSDRQPRHLS